MIPPTSPDPPDPHDPSSSGEVIAAPWPTLNALDRLRADLLARVAALPEPERDSRQARGGGWTPVQVLQHLLRVEELIVEEMDRRMGTDAPGGPAPRPSTRSASPRRRVRYWFGGGLVRAIFLLGIRVRMPTRKVDPGPPILLDEVIRKWVGGEMPPREGTPEPGAGGFTGVATTLRHRLQAAEARDPASPVMLHPVSGPLTPRTATAFLLRHMKHHERQLNRILAEAPRGSGE